MLRFPLFFVAVVGCGSDGRFPGEVGSESAPVSLKQDDAVTIGAFERPATPASKSPATDTERLRMSAYLSNRVPPSELRAQIRVRGKLFDCIEINRQLALRSEGLSPEEVPRVPEGWDGAGGASRT